MKELVSTISSKGQVTIPIDVRRRLGVGASDKVVFVIADSGRVEMRPVRYRVADLRGIVPALPGRETVDFDELIAEAFDEQEER
jgi:antitoxin PrlF